MKKFLTVLLALSVVFTYSFSAVGTAFAVTDSDEFDAAVSAFKTSLQYNGDGYLSSSNDDFDDEWNGTITKTILEAAIDEWADNVNLEDVDYVTDSALTDEAKAAMKAAIVSDVVGNQYASNLAQWNALVATIDLSAYNTAGRTAVQTAIEDGEDAIEAAAVNTIEGVSAVSAQIAALKATVKGNESNLLSEASNTLAETVAALQKVLDDASYEYYAYAKEWFDANAVTTASEVAAKASFDTDYNALVAYIEDCIERYESEAAADKTPFATAGELTAVINKVFATLNNTPVSASGAFQTAVAQLEQRDVWVAYYEKAAATAKTELNTDGTKKYYDADVDQLLADTKAAVEDDLWAAMSDGTWGNTATVAWNLTSIANADYNLQAYRNAATAKFTSGDYDLSNWTGARKDKVEALQDEYAEKILLADSVDAIDALVKEAKAAIDEIMTSAEVNAVAAKVASRIKAAGYLTTCNVKADGEGTVEEATGDGFDSYFDVVVGSSTTYKDAIKTDALIAAAQVFVDAVLAEEDADITYSEIDAIIAANKDAAYAALTNVKTTAELKDEAAAVAALIKALPTTITIADKDQVLEAQAAMDAYVENAGAKQSDVSKYATLKSALTTIINAEAREVSKLIRALPAASNVTVDDADQIAAARAAYDALEAAYGDYIGTEFTDATLPDLTKLEAAEAALESAKLAYAAKLIDALTNDSTEAEIEAAKAAFDALTTEYKLALNDQLYTKLTNAVASLEAKRIKAVEALKITASSSAVKGSITVKWTVKGDTSVADGFQVYRSLKMNSGFGTKAFFTTTDNTKRTYKNTKSLKKGTRYYYKVRAYKVVDGKTYYSDWSNKAYRIAK